VLYWYIPGPNIYVLRTTPLPLHVPHFFKMDAPFPSQVSQSYFLE